MTVEQTGAILAALTTSIPETIGESRNWDYRYCWLRDASMSIGTLLQMGHPNAARRFIYFIKRIMRSKHDSFQIMYGIRGERVLTEEVLPHLAGYAGSKPVRIGNAAYAQKQNDSFGYLLDVIHTYYNFFGSSLDDIEEMWELVKKMVGTVQNDWRTQDQSIWEFRNKKEHFVFSKVMCWVSLDRGAKIAGFLGRSEEERLFRADADAVREEVISKGWNSGIQSFSQAYGSTEVDSSLLLMEQYGFISADSELFVKTVDRIKQELFHNGLMYRYTISDDLGRPSSAFTICAFWLARALYVTGRQEEAVRIFEDVIAHCNHVGLLSEDLDFNTGRQLGNFPQAYSHLALVEVASILSKRKLRPPFLRP
jgi:GH15 family glucan-1,4-alpha-glucosidase